MNIIMYTPHFREFPSQLFNFLFADQRVNFKGLSSFSQVKRELDCADPTNTLLLMGRERDFHDVANMSPDDFEHARECFYLRQAAKSNRVRVVETADLIDSLGLRSSKGDLDPFTLGSSDSIPLHVEQRFVEAINYRLRHTRLDLH